MNHYAPRRGEDGRWRSTNSTPREGVYAIGYCVPWKAWTRDERRRLFIAEEEWDRLVAHRGCYHGEGHATKGEAIACYRRFLLDTAVQLALEEVDAHEDSPCAVCAAPTRSFAVVGSLARYWLCHDHQTITTVEVLFGGVEESSDAA